MKKYRIITSGVLAVALLAQPAPAVLAAETDAAVTSDAPDTSNGEIDTTKSFQIGDSGVTLTGGTQGIDFNWNGETKVLTIQSNTPMKLSGSCFNDEVSIVIAPDKTANVTFEDLMMRNENMAALTIGEGSTLNLTLSGSINNISNMQGTIIQNHGSMIVSGDGTLNANMMYVEEEDSSAITGGNLQVNSGNLRVSSMDIDALTLTNGTLSIDIMSMREAEKSPIQIDDFTMQGGTLSGNIYSASIIPIIAAQNLTISGGTIRLEQPGGEGADNLISAENPSITGGLFYDGVPESNTVYGIHVAEGYCLQYAQDEDDQGIYRVVTGNPHGLTYSGNNATYENGVLLLQNGATVTASTNGVQHGDRIVIEDNAEVTLTLNNVSLWGKNAPILVGKNAKVNLILVDESENSLITMGRNDAALQLSDGASLTIDGRGKLKARCGEYSYAAAIGTGNNESACSITINNGTIDAESDGYGAAIGVGLEGNANITINDGNVHANGRTCIGVGGTNTGITKITINGGNITASGDVTDGVGIGSSYSSGETSQTEIEINGGTIEAASNFGIPIGADENTSIIINDGTISAKTFGGGAAIGGKEGCKNISIKITGGTIAATSQDHDATGAGSSTGCGAAIGAGINGQVEDITIIGGNIQAMVIGRQVNTLGAAIGCGTGNSSVSQLSITGGTILAKSDSVSYSDIDTGSSGSFDTANGNAVIFADDIQEPTNKQGIYFIGDGTGVIVGTSVIPTDDFTIPEGKTLIVGENQTLIIQKGVMLTNNGTLQNKGTVMNQGTINNNGHLEGISIEGDVRDPSDIELTYTGDNDGIVVYGDTITLTATMKRATTNNINAITESETVNFYLGDTDGILLDTANVESSGDTYTATLELPLSGDTWSKGFKIGDNIITADFGGVTGTTSDIGLAANKTKITLTVHKASQEAPHAPVVAHRTTNSITLDAIDGNGHSTVEYAYTESADVEPTKWQTNTTFNGLKAGTTYTFFARYTANDYYDVSDKSGGTTATTLSVEGNNQIQKGESITVGDTTVSNDGDNITITVNGTTTTISPVPSDGATVDKNGNVTAPTGSTVHTNNGPEINLPQGGIVAPSGTVTVPEKGSATVSGMTITASEDKPATLTPSGDTVLISGGATVTTGNGTVTLPETGGVLHQDGTLTYEVTITFNSQGGSTVEAQSITVETTVNEPAAPTKDNSSFIGWYTDANCTQRWDFSSPVTQDMTLYAGWQTSSDEPTPGPSEPSKPSQPSGPSDDDEDGENTSTVINPDGSTTTITEREDGSVTETTKFPDGTVVTEEKTPTGTVATTTEDSNGSQSIVTKEDGKTIADVTLSANGVADKEEDGSVLLPIPSLDVPQDGDDAQITVHFPDNDGVLVKVPVTAPTTGTVAVIVDEDGNETVIKDSIVVKDGLILNLHNGDTIVLQDKAMAFNDVSSTHWSKGDIDFVSARGLFTGVSEALFAPEDPMTRAMFMSVLARYAGDDTQAVAGEPWYAGAREWAMKNGVSDGTMMNASITREQLVTMLYRYIGSPETNADLSNFTDAQSISGYATDAMNWAVAEGIIGGMTSTTLAPQGTATRAQVAAMIHRFVTWELVGK